MHKNIDTHNFTDITKLSVNQAWDVLNLAVRRGRERKRGHQSIIGIDEKICKKWHKYVTLVYDMISNGVDYIAFDRKKKSLDEYYNTLSHYQLSSITAVSMDMLGLFMSSAMDNIPDAVRKIVFDKFHVMKHVNRAADSKRKEENHLFIEMGPTDLT